MANIEGSHIKPICDDCHNGTRKLATKKPDVIKRDEYMKAIHKVFNRMGPFRPEDVCKELSLMKQKEIQVSTVKNTLSRYFNEELIEGTLDRNGIIRYYPLENN